MFPWFKRKIACPYCLRSTPRNGEGLVCAFCGRALPHQYVKDYDELAPIFVQALGWKGVGKTVFLQAMTLMLTRMGQVWPDYSYAALDDVSQRQITDIATQLGQGKMPAPTQSGDQEVCLIELRNMARWGGRTLVTLDCSGEIFDTMKIPLGQARYVLSTPTVFMLIAAPGEGPAEGGHSCDQLLNNYINTLINRGVDLRRDPRTVVVVITKADRVSTLPKELRRYLLSDPLRAVASGKSALPNLDEHAMDEYVDYMRYISDHICAWLQTDVAGRNMQRLAERQGLNLRFALISSTGETPTNGVLSIDGLAPRRVLDPYFWALELQSA